MTKENAWLFDFEAIGSKWNIKVYDNLYEQEWIDLSNDIYRICLEFEHNYSRFIEDSFIGKLNKNKVLTDFPQELYNIFTYCQDLKDITKGSFDICRYGSNHLSIAKLDILYNNCNISFISKNKIEIEENTNIDLDGIGKGWLIDKMKYYLETKNIKYFQINGSGDLYVSSQIDQKFHILLENPFLDNESIGYIELENESLSCSSHHTRTWEDQKTGEVYHHLINALTGKPISAIRAVFTKGKNAKSTDYASTMIFVSSLDLKDSIAEFMDIEYLIIFETGQYIKSSNFKGIIN